MLLADKALQAPGDLLERSKEAAAAADIQEGLVDGDRLDHIGEAAEELEQRFVHRE